MIGLLAKPDWEELGPRWPHGHLSRFVRSNGLNWHVQQFGAGVTGPVFLLLHGTGASGHSWRDVAPVLADAGPVIVLDLPGHGFTGTPSASGLTLDGMSRATARLLDDLGISPDVIIGHSAGAAVGFWLAYRGGSSARALVSLNGALFPFRGAASPLFSLMARLIAYNPVVAPVVSMRALDRRAIVRLVGQTGSVLDEAGLDCYRHLMTSAGHVSAVLRMMAHWDVAPIEAALQDFPVPLIAAASRGDRAVSPQEAARLARAVPLGHFLDLGAGGHLVHEERPRETVADILNVLREQHCL